MEQFNTQYAEYKRINGVAGESIDKFNRLRRDADTGILVGALTLDYELNPD